METVLMGLSSIIKEKKSVSFFASILKQLMRAVLALVLNDNYREAFEESLVD
jgi:hypothetical protein